MIPRSTFVVCAILAAALPATLHARAWKSADGSRSVEGEFLRRGADSVTIRNAAGSEIVIPLSKLHQDDCAWLDREHPAAGTPAETAEPDSAAVFDTLVFGDTRDVVLKKLKASKIVEMVSDEAFIGRSGLNGAFQTRQKIGELSGFLYFDWTAKNELKELTLQTETLPAASYRSQLEPSWKEFVELLSTLYGKPEIRGPLPAMESIPDGAFAPSHLWKLESGPSVLLGTARDGTRYQLVVRFTQKSVQPVALP